MALHLNPWYWITIIGTPELWMGVATGMALFYIFWIRRGEHKQHTKQFLLIFVISMLVVFTTAVVTKEIFQIPRPCAGEPTCPDGYSFPSGHSATGFAVMGSFAFFIGRKGIPLILVAFLVAWSRVALGVHTVPDIVAGSALGAVTPLVVWFILKHRKV